MPYVRIIKEIPQPFERELAIGRTIHKITMPEVTDSGFYRQTTSYNAFAHGGVRSGRKAPCHAPGRLFYCHSDRLEHWLREQQRIAGDPILADLDERLRPAVEHASIWAFYEHVGWDYKAKRWVK